MRSGSPCLLMQRYGRRQERRRPLHHGLRWRERAAGQLLGWQRHEEPPQSLSEHLAWKGVCQEGPAQATSDQTLGNVDLAGTIIGVRMPEEEEEEEPVSWL